MNWDSEGGVCNDRTTTAQTGSFIALEGGWTGRCNWHRSDVCWDDRGPRRELAGPLAPSWDGLNDAHLFPTISLRAEGAATLVWACLRGLLGNSPCTRALEFHVRLRIIERGLVGSLCLDFVVEIQHILPVFFLYRSLYTLSEAEL